MLIRTSCVALTLAMVLGACSEVPEDTKTDIADATSAETMPEETTIAMATLQRADGSEAGTVEITDTGTAVMLNAALSNIEPGAHGFHLHTVGSCDAPDFTSAEGHLNPLNKSHGFESDNGPHVGDMRNVDIAADGTGTVTETIEGDAAQVAQWLFDADGTAVIVHAQPDDYQTDPSGDAGARVACGVLTRS